MRIKISCIYIFLSVVFAFSANALANEKYSVTILGPSVGFPERNTFVESLLTLIFEKQQYELNLVYLNDQMTQTRALKELRKGNRVDLEWTVTSNKREIGLRSIKIPIYRGLIGWRVFFIDPSKQHQFNKVKSLNDLKNLVAVQPIDWPDHDILKHAGLPVSGNTSYHMITKILTSHLADYYPRSVLEIQKETTYPVYQGLVIEKNIVINYPSAFYFFVNQKNEKLYRIIEEGFKAVIDDGSYFTLFNQHFGGQLDALNLEKRTVITIKNPNFPESSKKVIKDFWFTVTP